MTKIQALNNEPKQSIESHKKEHQELLTAPEAVRPEHHLIPNQVKEREHGDAKNLMFLTFKILRKVTLAFQDLEKMGKEVVKSTKREWEYFSERSAKNFEKAKDGSSSILMKGAQLGGLVSGFAESAFELGVKGGYIAATNASLKTAAKALTTYGPQACNGYTTMAGKTTEYETNMDGSMLQQKTGEFASNYQNGTGDQSSNKQLVSEMGSTLQQLLRIQGEMLTGKA